MHGEQMGFAFFFGAFSSIGICLVSCTPILLSYLLATERKTKRFVTSLLFFILVRAGMFVAVTLVILSLGRLALDFIAEYALILRILGGTVISAAGVLIFFDLAAKLRFFRTQSRGLLILAVLFGVKPCLPHIAIWGYILVTAGGALADGLSPAAAALQAGGIVIAFTAGENIIPLILGLFGGKTIRYLRGRGFRIATKVGGGVLFLLGIVFIFYEWVAPIIARAFA